MSLSYPHLFIAGHTSRGKGLEAYEALGQLPQTQALRFGQIHGRLIYQFWNCQKDPLSELNIVCEDSLFLQNPSPQLVSAYFRQSQATLKHSLLVLEGPLLSAVLSTSQKLIEGAQFEPVDFERSHGSSENAVAYLANGNMDLATPLIPKNMSATLLKNPSAHTLSLFNI